MHDSPDSGEWLAHAHQDLANRYQALFFVPANFNIKIGPGDEAMVECTTGSLPAIVFVADLRRVIDHHNAEGVDNVCIEITCQDTCQVPATNSSCTGCQDTLQFRNLYSTVPKS